MIFRAFALAALLAISAAQAPFADEADAVSDAAPKGWVLFSWQTNKGWYFSLLPGTNRTKSWTEVNLAKVLGFDALKGKLRNIGAGERLEYGAPVHIADLPSDRTLENPTTEVRRQIARISREAGFKVGQLPRKTPTIKD
jgi:hypothetical protein